MRFVRNLEGSCNVSFALARRKQRETPALVLDKACQRYGMAEAPPGVEVNIAEVSAVKEKAVYIVAAKAYLDGFVRADPVRAVGAIGNSLPSRRRVSQNVSLVGIAVQVTHVPVKETSARGLNQAGKIRVCGLGTKV